MKRLVFYKNKCIGCRLCEQWCVSSHESLIQPSLARIHIHRDHINQKDIATYCHLCKDTPCLQSCPTSAIRWDESHTFLQVDKQLCTGCKQCEEVCPFHYPRLDPRSHTILICDLCGGNPSCVSHCPEEAIIYK